MSSYPGYSFIVGNGSYDIARMNISSTTSSTSNNTSSSSSTTSTTVTSANSSNSHSNSQSKQSPINVSVAITEGNTIRHWLHNLSIDTTLIPSKLLVIGENEWDTNITQVLNSSTFLFIVTDTVYPSDCFQFKGLASQQIPIITMSSEQKLGIRGIVYPSPDGKGFTYIDRDGKTTPMKDYKLIWIERNKFLKVTPEDALGETAEKKKKRSVREAYSSDFDKAKESAKKRRRVVKMEKRIDELKEEACNCKCWDCDASLSMDILSAYNVGRMRVTCICTKNDCGKPIEKDSTALDSVESDTVSNPSLLSSPFGYLFGGSSSSSTTTQTN